ncbi:hypothetical protein Q7P35_001943 [Cladosporium inversicolor]
MWRVRARVWQHEALPPAANRNTRRKHVLVADYPNLHALARWQICLPLPSAVPSERHAYATIGEEGLFIDRRAKKPAWRQVCVIEALPLQAATPKMAQQKQKRCRSVATPGSVDADVDDNGSRNIWCLRVKMLWCTYSRSLSLATFSASSPSHQWHQQFGRSPYLHPPAIRARVATTLFATTTPPLLDTALRRPSNYSLPHATTRHQCPAEYTRSTPPTTYHSSTPTLSVLSAGILPCLTSHHAPPPFLPPP